MAVFYHYCAYNRFVAEVAHKWTTNLNEGLEEISSYD
jgi:hypothetical protein